MHNIRVKVADVLTGAVALLALAVLARSLLPQKPARAPREDDEIISNWRTYSTVGHRIGPPNSIVTIVEFGDYECPACRRMEPRLRAILDTYDTEVSLVYRHYPLTYHARAYDAARAAECAGKQGKFWQYHTLLYDQASLAAVSWSALAVSAGIPDTVGFNACASHTGKVQSIEEDMTEFSRLGGSGTPTILLDSLRFGGLPDSATLDDVVRKLIAKRKRAQSSQ